MTTPATSLFAPAGTQGAFSYANPNARPVARAHRRITGARRRSPEIIEGPWPTVASNAPLAVDMSYQDDGTDEHVRAYVSRLWAEDWDNPEDALYDDL
ncbi:hypothetical protein Mth01_49280 [Sphaerimonospora thailandensis]|uniref:Uncharacterized protein n=1 Tax=Sphaerimonospora thailandensis TaxID=795644 RepID=A0A8J3RDJ6_9ACTN|nr:hypothetical protein Mth01_49280 [Sphaerimonospora thailandensis]